MARRSQADQDREALARKLIQQHRHRMSEQELTELIVSEWQDKHPFSAAETRAAANAYRIKRSEELLREAGYVPDPRGGKGWVRG